MSLNRSLARSAFAGATAHTLDPKSEQRYMADAIVAGFEPGTRGFKAFCAARAKSVSFGEAMEAGANPGSNFSAAAVGFGRLGFDLSD